MAHQAGEHNPFMLMINPDVVVSAMQKSERLRALNRHLCRPLDRPLPAGANAAAVEDEAEDPGESGTPR